MPIVGSDSSTQGVGNQWRTAPPRTVSVDFEDKWLDAFGGLNVSLPGNRFDCEFIYNKQPELFDEITNGAGLVNHNAASRDLVLDVGGAGVGDNAAMWGHYDVPYTPGNGQVIEITGTLDEAAIGSGTAFFFVRTTVTGSTVETTYEEGVDWSAATTVDWTKSQILALDFQSLRVGRIRMGMNRNGALEQLLNVYNDNIRNTGYWQTPNLPPFWRIYNDATYTYMEMGYGDTANAIGVRYRIAVNASAQMRAICVTVKSQNGAVLADMPGFQRGIATAASATVTNATLIPLLSIRPAATYATYANRGVYVPNGFTLTTDNPIRYKILYRPSLTGAAFAAVDATNSGVEYDVTASAVANGIAIVDDHLYSAKNVPNGLKSVLDRVILSLGRTGTADILTVAAIATTGTNATVQAALQWKEIR